jgi:hypothetical protein
MRSKQIFLIAYLFSLYVFFYACYERWDPISSSNLIYETDYGTITQIDDYPLFELNYSFDYKFDAYLQTGNIPFYTSNNSNSKNYCCTCFSVFGEDNRFLI